MPKQTDIETSVDPARYCWERLASAAEMARLGELPWFSELESLDREALFRELGYTFWNRELVDALAARMRAEACETWLELAAGTGRLAAALACRGIPIAATDDYSQAPEAVRARQRAITYGEWVGRLTAREAMAAFVPDGVVCAWPPLGSCLVPDLLGGVLPGCQSLRLIVCIGDPDGATEAPRHAFELPAGWSLESWPECARWLFGFNDPPEQPGRYSRLLVYRKAAE